MYREEHVVIIHVVCDICKSSKEIGKNMSWDGKFNGSIGAGYKTDIVDGKVRNICKNCQ